MVRRPLIPVLLLLAACTSSAPSDRTGFDQPGGAAEYAAMRRSGTDDPHRAYATARAKMRQMPRYATNGDALVDPRAPRIESESNRTIGRWQFLGPGNIGGRTRSVIIDPREPNVMFAAGVSGGIWRSRSAGELWEPVADDMANISVSAMAMHPADSRMIFAGTGEGFFRENVRGTALPLRGNGIFVTRDRGDSWSQLASTANENFHWVNDLVISSHDPSRMYAATRTGVWRSTDGGETWSRVLETQVNGGCLDLAWRGDTDGDYLFASCGTFAQATIYRHANAESDSPWQSVLSEPLMGRTTLAIAPSNPSTIYALSASNEPGARTYQGMLAVWRSDQSGAAGSWTAQVTNKTKEDPVAPRLLTNPLTDDWDVCVGAAEQPTTMGWYCNVIAVDPADPNKVWVGGVDLFRSDDGGRTWGVASYWWAEGDDRYPWVHADQHAIVFHPQYDGVTNKIAFFSNDGGVFRTDDARGSVITGKNGLCAIIPSAMRFVSLNNSYGVTQFYHGAVFPDGRRFIGGTQDNGTIEGSIENGPNMWRRAAGGDGGYVAIDPLNPELVYAESQYGFFRMSRDGGDTFTPWLAGLNDKFLFLTPFTLDHKTTTLWLGGTSMWRSKRHDRWQRASALMPDGGAISAVAASLKNSNRVIAGTNKGDIVRSDAAVDSTSSTQWASTRPRAGFVSSITYDPNDDNIVYATYAGFGGVHLWKSSDAGATWAPLDGIGDGALPDIPVHSLAVDPTRDGRVYLGTDLGVFVSLDGGQSWAVENSGFASAVTEHVTIGQGAAGLAIYAFTHGRGAWRAELTVAGPKRRAIRK
jgi:photosystem II stability/assembly factor-like uncharacterized protein